MRGLRPSNIIVVETGERVADEKRLLQLRAENPGAPCLMEFLDESQEDDQENPGAPCLMEFLDESQEDDQAMLRRTLAFPDSIVASDAMPLFWPDGSYDSTEWPLPPGGSTHPRASGTFSKTLRLMVRESGAWTWLEAFRRCSYLPARLLDDCAPGARAKGHLGVGADADIVVLDPERITDAATYTDPLRPSVGVRHLFVAGTPVVRQGELQVDALPGQPLRGEAR